MTARMPLCICRQKHDAGRESGIAGAAPCRIPFVTAVTVAIGPVVRSQRGSAGCIHHLCDYLSREGKVALVTQRSLYLAVSPAIPSISINVHGPRIATGSRRLERGLHQGSDYPIVPSPRPRRRQNAALNWACYEATVPCQGWRFGKCPRR